MMLHNFGVFMPEGYIEHRTETGRNLTPKQEAFAQLYIETGNASEAFSTFQK